jgi:hypothetical protein
MIEHIDNAEDITQLVESELNQITNTQLKEALMQVLVSPILQMRGWEYSHDEERFPCWVVADLQRYDLCLAYCEYGHGSSGDKWGAVKLSDSYIGSDDSWFSCLEDAFIGSGCYNGPIAEGYEVK